MRWKIDKSTKRDNSISSTPVQVYDDDKNYFINMFPLQLRSKKKKNQRRQEK